MEIIHTLLKKDLCLATPLFLSASGKSFELVDLIFALRVLMPYLGR